jgi:hypothetical protein
MTVSEKQLEANRQNAQLGGVKTPEGKEIVKYNAMKHGLLAKEVVITIGEGAENPEEFNALLRDLSTQLKPEGMLEDVLVEKIAVSYWRLRRAYRYEVGLIRQELDTATDKFYSKTNYGGDKKNKTDEEIEQQIAQEKEGIEYWEKDKKDLTVLHDKNTPLEELYEWYDNWNALYEKISDLVPDEALDSDEEWIRQLREYLNNKLDWSDDQIWQAHIELCDEKAKHHKEQVLTLEKEKEKNKLKLQVLRKLGNIPSKDELDRLLRYEGAIERQFYKAMNQLERLQRMRSGESVPAPLAVDVDVNTGQGS